MMETLAHLNRRVNLPRIQHATRQTFSSQRLIFVCLPTVHGASCPNSTMGVHGRTAVPASDALSPQGRLAPNRLSLHHYTSPHSVVRFGWLMFGNSYFRMIEFPRLSKQNICHPDWRRDALNPNSQLNISSKTSIWKNVLSGKQIVSITPASSRPTSNTSQWSRLCRKIVKKDCVYCPPPPHRPKPPCGPRDWEMHPSWIAGMEALNAYGDWVSSFVLPIAFQWIEEHKPEVYASVPEHLKDDVGVVIAAAFRLVKELPVYKEGLRSALPRARTRLVELKIHRRPIRYGRVL